MLLLKIFIIVISGIDPYLLGNWVRTGGPLRPYKVYSGNFYQNYSAQGGIHKRRHQYSGIFDSPPLFVINVYFLRDLQPGTRS